MASPFTADQPFKDINVINESERSIDPADDEGKLVQLEADGLISADFIDFERSILQQTLPVVESTQTTAQSATATSHVVSMPSGIQVGDLLVVVFRNGFAEYTHTPSAGWSLINSTIFSTNGRASVYAKVATGSDSLTITTSSTCESASVAYRLSNTYPSISAASAVFANGAAAATLPKTEAPAGIRNYLWIGGVTSRSNSVATVAPTDYTGLISVRSSGTSGVSRAMVATAVRGRRALVEGGGSFTITELSATVSFTIGIRPNLINSKWDL